MPKIAKTIIPRIRKSLRDRGLMASLRRSFLLPVHLIRELWGARFLRPDPEPSEFDLAHGVDTEGEFGGWTYLSDLEISSPNWIEGNDYAPIEPHRLERVLASFEILFEEYTFVDFGSGKGRALLLASAFPFKRIIGLEFSPELHGIAQENLRRYRSEQQKCSDIQSINVDFVEFLLPPEPLVLFFFDPCHLRVLAEVVARLGQSLIASPRPLYVAYVAVRPEQEQLFRTAGFLKEIVRNTELNFAIYKQTVRP
jgi:SAM-dependent methyltransferase